jgi:hypothetical protein
MGMGAQGQQGTQVYYDDNTGQYYTQPTQTNSNPFFSMLGLTNKNANRNYINNFNNQSMTARPVPEFTPIDIAALFPQLSQAATGIPASSLLGAEGVVPVEGESKGAAKSSGAGRFL